MTPDIIFPHLGIEIAHISREAFSIGGFGIYWYGVFIALGILVGAVASFANTKLNNVNNDMFMDFILWSVTIAMICTRLYYVIFNFDNYKDNLLKIFDFRDGGMGVYGGIISGILVCVIFAKIRKIKMGQIADAAVFGLVAGQVFGRVGNFFNQEAFGDYTNNLFAMRLKLPNVDSSSVTQKMRDNLHMLDGVSYIQVHPTFLYEMLLNIGIFIIMWVYRKRKVFYGELLNIYVILYALGRFFIESLRTDQLFLWNTDIPVSMLVSGILFAGGVAYYIYRRVKARGNELDLRASLDDEAGNAPVSEISMETEPGQETDGGADA
ncbi:MAG: prolipoprotein diacylglyceryl transferase [Clostridiales bacterium]|jgi:phosphatidylglycerol:prolipoprotein diacylglycerol transferase|nr:prolipoprotein diacylglyceryl transferase [Clostridiales bacterium]